MNSIPANVRSEIPRLRELHGSIYLLDLTEFHVNKLTSCAVIRPLTRREFNSFTEDYLLDPIASTSLLVKKCVLALSHDLHDENWENWLAGLDEYIVTAVSQVSGFSSEDTLAEGIEVSRDNAQSLESVITVFICKAFPKYSPSDVDNMTFEEQMRLASLAEVLIGIPIPYEEFFGGKKDKESSQPQRPHIPVPDGMMSHGAQPPPNPRLNRPPSMPDREVVVTSDNLADIMRETQEIFSG